MNKDEVDKIFEKQLVAISLYFRELRFSENLTQAEVASESGLHRNTISNIERSKNYEIQTLFQLCDFYQTPASELFSIIDEI